LPGGFFVSREQERLFALGSDRVSRFTVDRVVTHLRRRLIRPQRHDEGDHLEDDEGRDHVVDDDERCAFSLQHELLGVAVEQARDVDARRFLSVPIYISMSGLAKMPVSRPPVRPATPWVENTLSVSSTFIMKRVFCSLFIASQGMMPAMMIAPMPSTG
jgi:hypothetical protein